jgi:hypothetical protein
MTRFEWDPRKDVENQGKHGVAFATAQLAFADPRRKEIYERENQVHE